MKITLLLLLMSIFVISNAQRLKKVTNKDTYSIEEFYVLNSNRNIKQGEFKKLRLNGKLSIQGYFSNNKKDSTWVYYTSNGKDTLAYGKYSENKPIGQWIYNNYKGEFRYIFDFNTNKVLKYNWDSATDSLPILTDTGWKEMSVDNPPLINDMERYENMNIFVARNIRYPIKAQDNGISGQILVAFTVNEQGEMSNVRLKKGVYPELDNEAIRVISLINEKWYPSLKDGNPVTVEHSLPINFILK